jgi:hypothetical protein
MKKYGLVFYFLLVVSALSAQTLTGTWKGTTEGETVGFIFDKEGFVSMQSEGELLGGKRYEVDGKFFCMKYVLQKEGKIRNLDMIVYNLKTNKPTQRMLCIVEWISDNKIRLCIGMDEPDQRPKDFKNKEDVIILTRE